MNVSEKMEANLHHTVRACNILHCMQDKDAEIEGSTEQRVQTISDATSGKDKR